MRIGQSTDIHQLVEGRDLILGGVKIEHSKGLLGHSDADVLIHAIMEALIGAMGLGDLGKHFPDTDPQWKGADSRMLLRAVVDILSDMGFTPGNVDITIMAQAPKMAPHILQMRQNIAADLRLAVDRVSVKATTTERLGFTGRGEGIAAEAVCMVVKNGVAQ